MKPGYSYSERGMKFLPGSHWRHDSLCVCCDANSLLEELGFPHDIQKWQLFIDSLKLSFTTVLLCNADVELLIAVACSVAKKEYTKIQICYSFEMWSITRSMVGRCVVILRWLDSLLDLRMGHAQFWFFFLFGTIKQLKDMILWSTDLPEKILFPEHIMLRTFCCWISRRCFCPCYT